MQLKQNEKLVIAALGILLDWKMGILAPGMFHFRAP